MTAALFRPVLFALIVCLLLVSAARLMPQTEPDVTAYDRLFFTSSYCPTACLMGIQPEASTLIDAIAVLSAHDWVGDIHTGRSATAFQRDVTVTWDWSGAQPAVIRTDRPGVLFARWYGGINSHIITGISVETDLRFEDVRQHLNLGSSGTATAGRREIRTVITYASRGLRNTISTQVPCPARLMIYWQARTRVSQGGQIPGVLAEQNTFSPANLRRLCR